MRELSFEEQEGVTGAAWRARRQARFVERAAGLVAGGGASEWRYAPVQPAPSAPATPPSGHRDLGNGIHEITFEL